MRIPELYARGGPVFSFEFFLPKSPGEMERFKRTVVDLKRLRPGFVTMTYGAGGTSPERTVEVAGMIRGELGLETAAHLTCITHTREEVVRILGRIRDQGIENIVALRGDLPRPDAGLPQALPGELPHAVDLVRLIHASHPFAVGVAGYPEKHPEAPSPEADLEHLKAKVASGADWIITQLFFDNGHYFDFVRKARAAGIGCPIVPGIMPVTGFSQLQKFSTMCGTQIPAGMADGLSRIADDREAVSRYGVDFATRQCRELLDGGAPGIHFYTLNKSHATTTILSRLRDG